MCILSCGDCVFRPTATAVFTLLNTLVVTLGLFLSSRKRVPDKLKEVMFSAAAGKKEQEPEEKDA